MKYKYEKLIEEVIQRVFIVYRVIIVPDDIIAIRDRTYFQHLGVTDLMDVNTYESVIVLKDDKLKSYSIELHDTLHFIDKDYIIFKKKPMRYRNKIRKEEYDTIYFHDGSDSITLIRYNLYYLMCSEFTKEEFYNIYELDYTKQNFDLIDEL